MKTVGPVVSDILAGTVFETVVPVGRTVESICGSVQRVSESSTLCHLGPAKGQSGAIKLSCPRLGFEGYELGAI
jgi:hypothetical protein